VVTGALVLGAVATGMLLGHWYLIDLGLSIEPLERLFRYFVAVLLVQLAVAGVMLGLLATTSSEGAAAVARLWHEHRPLLVTRVVLGPVAALGVAWLIHRTLRIPQTMAATGLFYIAILAVLVGEMLGRLILFRTSLPL
jgi:predicted Na+-dependent transporter